MSEGFTPYGFCEIWMAEKLGIEFFSFPITDGEVAAIGQRDFERISNTLNGRVYPTSFMDAYISINKFWKDWNIVDSLTDGPTKESGAYADSYRNRENMTTDQVENSSIDLLERSGYFTEHGETLITPVAMPAPTLADGPVAIQVPTIETQDVPVAETPVPTQEPAAPVAEVTLDTVMTGYEWIDETFVENPNNEYLAKILRAFPNADYDSIGDTNNWIVSLVGSIDDISEQIKSINSFGGMDIVVSREAAYGDIDVDMLSVSEFIINDRAASVGMPSNPIASISRIGIYEYDCGGYSGKAFPFIEGTISAAVPKSGVDGAEFIMCGDYQLGLIRGNHVKLFSELRPDILEFVVGTMNGETYDYAIDFRSDAFSHVSHDKTEAGNYTYLMSSRGDKNRELIGKIADKLGKSVIYTTSTPGNKVSYIRDALSIDRTMYNRIKDDIVLICNADSSYDYRDVESLVLGITVTRLAVPHIENGGYEKFDFIFRDTVSNNVFALMEGKNIVITAGVGGRNASHDTVFFENMLFRMTPDLTYDEIHAHDLSLYERVTIESKTRYGKMFVKDVMKDINDRQLQLQHNETRYNELMDEVMNLAGKIRSSSMEFNAIDVEKLQLDNEKIAEEDFANILQLDAVSNIVINNDTLNVYTNNIYVQHDVNKKWYDIGTFHVRVNMGRENYDTSGTTRIFNTKYSVRAYENGMNAPHVFRAGNLCHGNLGRAIGDSYKNRDVFGVVYQIILFLTSANLDDVAGAKLDKWIEVSEEVAKGNHKDTETVYGTPETAAFDSEFAAALGVSAS